MCVCERGGGELGQQFSNSSDAEGGCAMDFGLDGRGGGGGWTIVETEGSGAKTGVVVTNKTLRLCPLPAQSAKAYGEMAHT